MTDRTARRGAGPRADGSTADRDLVVEILHVRHASSVAAIPTGAGPERLLEAGLVGRLDALGATVDVVEIRPSGVGPSNPVAEAFHVASRVADGVRAALDRRAFPLVLSGSCHAGLGAVSGLGRGRRGVVWLDCHGDFNTPDTSLSGLVDGTTLAAITGRGWAALSSSVEGFAPVRDGDVVLVGARDLDPGEEALLESSGVQRVETGENPTDPVLRRLAREVDEAYLHLDLDVLDPSVGVANAWAKPGGLTGRGLRQLLRSVAEVVPVRALGLASYDPEVDPDGQACREALDAVEAFFGALP